MILVGVVLLGAVVSVYNAFQAWLLCRLHGLNDAERLVARGYFRRQVTVGATQFLLVFNYLARFMFPRMWYFPLTLGGIASLLMMLYSIQDHYERRKLIAMLRKEKRRK